MTGEGIKAGEERRETSVAHHQSASWRGPSNYYYYFSCNLGYKCQCISTSAFVQTVKHIPANDDYSATASLFSDFIVRCLYFFNIISISVSPPPSIIITMTSTVEKSYETTDKLIGYTSKV